MSKIYFADRNDLVFDLSTIDEELNAELVISEDGNCIEYEDHVFPFEDEFSFKLVNDKYELTDEDLTKKIRLKKSVFEEHVLNMIKGEIQ